MNVLSKNCQAATLPSTVPCKQSLLRSSSIRQEEEGASADQSRFQRPRSFLYSDGDHLPWVPETFLARFPVSVKSL